MAARLTTFSKFLLTLLIVGGIVGTGWYFLNKTDAGKNLKEQSAQIENDANSDRPSRTNTSPSRNDDDVLRVQLVTWGGYGPGLYFNEGAMANTNSRYWKDYGFKVEFKVENDLINALNAWMADEYDVLVQTADAFPLYTAPDDINSFEPKAFMQVDWSRGGDAIIVKRGINTVNDLKGKRIAVAKPSPAQTLLISSLEAAGLTYEDVEVIPTTDNLKAAELFRSADVDAAVVWSPDDMIATEAVPGSKVLLTTVEQSNIIADIMFAKQSYINNNRDKINGFYEGWMKGVAELNNPANLPKAAQYLADLNGLSVEDGLGMASVVHWTSHGDNKDFFGLTTSKGQKGQDLYEKMSRKFVQTGDAEETAPAWRSVIYTGAITSADRVLTGAQYGSELAKTFTKSAADRTAAAFASKPVSINFATGQSTLTDNAKTIIDLQFADVAKSFGGVKVRIEGNTDNVGSVSMNMDLSQKRANSVAAYLRSAYGIDQNRLIVVGNGPNKPVAGCETNATAECKARNRRTEFQLIAG